MRKLTIWVPTMSDTNRAAQAQKMDIGWKLRIQNVQELYYPCSENKGTDQLRSYCEADLRLCFRLCKLLVFSCRGSYVLKLSKYQGLKGNSVNSLIALHNNNKFNQSTLRSKQNFKLFISKWTIITYPNSLKTCLFCKYKTCVSV